MGSLHAVDIRRTAGERQSESIYSRFLSLSWLISFPCVTWICLHDLCDVYTVVSTL